MHKNTMTPQADKTMAWIRIPGVVTRWVWCSDTEPQYKYAQCSDGYWIAWKYGNEREVPKFDTREEARQWCEVHYACAA